MSDGGCVFCGIVKHNEPQHAVVAESDSALAFMDAYPVSLGHVLVIPKAHATDIWSLGADEGKETFDLARKVAAAMRKALRPDGLNLFQANGEAGWQTVFHFHIHVVPRWFDDAIVPPWTDPRSRVPEDIPETARRIRAGLDTSPA
jgi:histidine triad (HIT) family protein